MSETMSCPHCGGANTVTPDVRGKTVYCPHCARAWTVPATQAPVSPGLPPMPPVAEVRTGGESRAVVWLIAALVAGGVLFVGLLFVVGFVMGVNKAREAARRSSCWGNCCQIGLAMIQYAGDHDDAYMPLLDDNGTEVPTAGRVPRLPARTGFLVLLKDRYLTTTRVFVCPSSGEKAPEEFNRTFVSRGSAAHEPGSDFSQADMRKLVRLWSEDGCSYGWDPTKKHSADASCAILADKPPSRLGSGIGGDAKNNSPNHRGEGQNVFYNDGHSKWAATPSPDGGEDADFYRGGPGYEESTTDAKIIR